MQEIDAYDVLEKYTAVLSQPRECVIVDASELPYPKAIVRQVLVEDISRFQDIEVTEQLKGLLISLADFQELNEGERSALATFSTTYSESMTDNELANLASEMSEVGDEYKSVLSRYHRELDELKQLIDTL